MSATSRSWMPMRALAPIVRTKGFAVVPLGRQPQTAANVAERLGAPSIIISPIDPEVEWTEADEKWLASAIIAGCELLSCDRAVIVLHAAPTHGNLLSCISGAVHHLGDKIGALVCYGAMPEPKSDIDSRLMMFAWTADHRRDGKLRDAWQLGNETYYFSGQPGPTFDELIETAFSYLDFSGRGAGVER